MLLLYFVVVVGGGGAVLGECQSTHAGKWEEHCYGLSQRPLESSDHVQ